MNLTYKQKQEYYIMQKLAIYAKKPFNDSKNNVRDRKLKSLEEPLLHTSNLKIRYQQYLPAVKHNFTFYDCHLFVTQLGKHKCRFNVICKNTEQYIYLLFNHSKSIRI